MTAHCLQSNPVRVWPARTFSLSMVSAGTPGARVLASLECFRRCTDEVKATSCTEGRERPSEEGRDEEANARSLVRGYCQGAGIPVESNSFPWVAQTSWKQVVRRAGHNQGECSSR